MISVYVVVGDGCVRYVSADGNDVNVTVIDLDDMEYAQPRDKAHIEVDLAKAESLPRFW